MIYTKGMWTDSISLYIYTPIQYACRKTLADRRVRVRGRFARNTELCEEEMVMKKEDDNSPNDKNFYSCDAVQVLHFPLSFFIYINVLFENWKKKI